MHTVRYTVAVTKGLPRHCSMVLTDAHAGAAVQKLTITANHTKGHCVLWVCHSDPLKHPTQPTSTERHGDGMLLLCFSVQKPPGRQQRTG